ncbi:hypothetical protein EI94DRAFT_1806869 [Lactarius quietus]|nr:hypothetical protein EI94DRAFT_1806869 [Lactarius quietus]
MPTLGSVEGSVLPFEPLDIFGSGWLALFKTRHTAYMYSYWGKSLRQPQQPWEEAHMAAAEVLRLMQIINNNEQAFTS